MAEYFSHFDSASVHKRKRESDDVNGNSSDRDVKKRPTTSLPIRPPPPHRPAMLTASNFPTSIAGTLTPVDTSEDEDVPQDHDEGRWPDRLPSLTESQTGSESSTSSITVHVGVHDEDMDTEMNATSPPRPRTGRARSNDILSSPSPPIHHRPRPDLLSPGAPFIHGERMPTPISSHFDARLAALPAAPRHQFPPLRTYLSPMIEQDGWVRSAQGLPSPADEHDVDTDAVMVMDHTSSDMNGLRFSGDRDDVMETWSGEAMHMLGVGSHSQDLDAHLSLDENGARSQGLPQHHDQGGRTARLHMGYLGGCDKCMQKVPGHYSHILWS